MAYLYIENFEGGLDTRKTRFTAPAGSLRQLKNAHITRGKEIERRKAFEQIATLPAGTFGLHALGGRVYSFGSDDLVGSMPVRVSYQRLQDPDELTADMIRLWASENFSSKIYAVAEFDNGAVLHFYDGVKVTDWDALAEQIASVDTVAAALTLRLQDNDRASVTRYDASIDLEGDPGDTFFASSASTNISSQIIQNAAPAQPEIQATATLTVDSGTTAPGVNTISSLTVDGVDLIGSPLDYDTDDTTTATALATRINAGVTSYSANSSGPNLVIVAPAGLGASANGRTVDAVTTGNVQVTVLNNMAGGTDPVEAVSQIERFTVDTFVAGDVYDVTISGEGTYQVVGRSSAVPTSVKAFKQKMYAPTSSLVYFSGFRGTYASAGVRNPALPDPTMWVNYDDDPNDYGIGAGAINLAEQLSGSETAIGLGVYQNRLALFAKRTVQIWNVDPDPDLNSIYQLLLNVGAVSANSIIEYGDQDIFFLSETGLRSLRARDSSNIASTSDVGVPIDKDINEYVRSQPQSVVAQSRAVLEPLDGRYLLAIGSRVYVFSNFPGSSVSAWSTYELSVGSVEAWAEDGSQLFCRIGDTVRQYGGLDGLSYDTDETVVELPFLDAGQPAQEKQITGVDFGGTGVWEAKMATEPSLPDETDIIAVFDGDTYGSVGRAGVQGKSTHISLRLTTSQASEAIIGNVVLHYYPIEAS